MNQFHTVSTPNLDLPATSKDQGYDDLALQGVAANIKLLLKLIQDHQLACDQDKHDHRRMLRVATMLTILDNARERIQKCQSFGLKKPEAKLRRCNTDLRQQQPQQPKDKKPTSDEDPDDEKSRLKRELTASLAAQRNLKAMCSSIGKEKQIMVAELSKKVHELSEMEEIMNNLKAQNNSLRQRVQECLKSGGGSGGEERNKGLSERLMRSLEDYRSVKEKLKVAEEENVELHATVDEVGVEVGRSLERVRGLKDRTAEKGSVDLREEIVGLESMFEGFELLLEKNGKKQGEFARVGGEIGANKPPFLT